MICSCGKLIVCKSLCNNCYKKLWTLNNKQKRRDSLKKYHASEKAKNTHKKYRHSDKGRKTKNIAWFKYKTKKQQAMPIWVNEKLIKEIYINCPKGYQVDHIIPLNGIEVCGLHVPWNLQYLTPKENRIKGNRLCWQK